jgi:hypothetical protein
MPATAKRTIGSKYLDRFADAIEVTPTADS